MVFKGLSPATLFKPMTDPDIPPFVPPLEPDTPPADAARLLTEALIWLAALLDHSSEGVILVDPAGRVLGSNAASAALTGWAPAALQGHDALATLALHLLTWVPDARTFEEEPW